jgi:hypothetical protein
VLREYYHIKQNSESEEMSALLHFVAMEYDMSAENVKNKTIHCLSETDDPIEFLKRIKEAF